MNREETISLRRVFITMNAIVAKLRRLIGIQYEYKLEFQAFLTVALAVEMVADTDTSGNTPALREGFVDTFIGCGPSMSFEAKRAAYGALELITEAIAADDDVSPADATALNGLLVNTTRFVGLAEGDGEDFHFMVAAYNLAKEIARVITGTTIYGSILTLTLTTPGAGFTTDGVIDTAEDVVFTVSSTESSDPSNYADAEVTAEIIDGEIDSITLITDPGEGFFVGQVVELNISTAAPQDDATQTTAATATVASITD
jgi:hypothetical protein